MLDSATFAFARAVTYEIMNLYAVKMAAVFMITTSTLAIRTGVITRWIALLGYAFALFLLLSGRYIEWILMLSPSLVLLVRLYIRLTIYVGPLKPERQVPGPTHGAPLQNEGLTNGSLL